MYTVPPFAMWHCGAIRMGKVYFPTPLMLNLAKICLGDGMWEEVTILFWARALRVGRCCVCVWLIAKREDVPGGPWSQDETLLRKAEPTFLSAVSLDNLHPDAKVLHLTCKTMRDSINVHCCEWLVFKAPCSITKMNPLPWGFLSLIW